MKKEILRVRLTHNVKQLKKYIDQAIEKGAETIDFDMDKENPYFNFSKELTYEEEIELQLNELKAKCELLQKIKYKTHYLRIDLWGLSGYNIQNIIDDFAKEKNIQNIHTWDRKQVITDDYDDFNDEMQTIFITEIIEN